MTKEFDFTADDYDNNFTYTKVGRAQRTLVHRFLEKELSIFQQSKVLELNCGTGEDALWMGQLLNTEEIIATDVSTRMLDLAKLKNVNHPKISFQIEDAANLSSVIKQKKFDVIFSNFGGLNCLSNPQFKQLFEELSSMVDRYGSINLVLMPRFCLWESMYFLTKFKWKDAFRRNTAKAVKAKLSENVEVETWYYSPRTVKALLPESLKMTKISPVGFFIWPSYLNSWAIRFPKIFDKLVVWENKIAGWGFLSYLSDHYYVKIERNH